MPVGAAANWPTSLASALMLEAEKKSSLYLLLHFPDGIFCDFKGANLIGVCLCATHINVFCSKLRVHGFGSDIADR